MIIRSTRYAEFSVKFDFRDHQELQEPKVRMANQAIRDHPVAGVPKVG